MKTSFKIFINYRREDTSGYAGRIFDSLEKEFGEENIFIDVTKINTGSDYTEVIIQALDLSNYFLILIGNDWLNCKDSLGNNRINNADDFVRKEISLAINKKIKIIPILLQDAKMPFPQELPDDIKEMCKWQAIEVADTRWKHDVEKLMKSISLKRKLFVFNWKFLLAASLVLIFAFLIGIWRTNSKGTVIHPLTPKEYYHNAKIYELNGDFVNARKCYKEYLKFNLLFIDPHLSYQSLIKSQEGKTAAREEYAALISTKRNSVIEFANCLLMDRTEAIDSLLQLIKKDSKFAPAFYQLSIEYSQDKLGERPLSEKFLERKYLVEFLHLDSLGHNQKYYLDKTIPEEQVKDAATRLKQSDYATDALKNPVSLYYTLTNNGWMITVTTAEQATKIYYKFNTDSDYHSTGSSGYQYSGTDVPNPTIMLAHLKNGRYPVSIKYVDKKGGKQGPFDLVFDTQKERLLEVKKNLALIMPWISYREYDGRLLIYFSALLNYTDVIKEIKYSVDNQSLSKTFPIQPWTKGGIPLIEGDIYIYVPLSTKYVYVKLTFIDNSESEIKRFDNDVFSN